MNWINHENSLNTEAEKLIGPALLKAREKRPSNYWLYSPRKSSPIISALLSNVCRGRMLQWVGCLLRYLRFFFPYVYCNLWPQPSHLITLCLNSALAKRTSQLRALKKLWQGSACEPFSCNKMIMPSNSCKKFTFSCY